MARPIYLGSLTPAERMVFGGGLGLFASGFVPFWYRTATIEGSVNYNAGLTRWSVVAVLAGAIAAVTILVRASIWPEPAPRKDGLWYAFLGLLAVATLAANAAGARGVWVGVYVGIVLSVTLMVGGLWRRAERRSGWT